jgi:hypothetical protein
MRMVPAEFPAIDQAAKATSLIVALAGTNEAHLPTEKVKAIARAARLNYVATGRAAPWNSLFDVDYVVDLPHRISSTSCFPFPRRAAPAYRPLPPITIAVPISLFFESPHFNVPAYMLHSSEPSAKVSEP